MNTNWQEQFFSSIFLILLFPVFIFFTFPREPTTIDFIWILIGIVCGFLLGSYFVRGSGDQSRKPMNGKTNRFIGLISGAITVTLLSIAQIWFGKRFTGSVLSSIFSCLFVTMILVMIYHWRHRPRT